MSAAKQWMAERKLKASLGRTNPGLPWDERDALVQDCLRVLRSHPQLARKPIALKVDRVGFHLGRTHYSFNKSPACTLWYLAWIGADYETIREVHEMIVTSQGSYGCYHDILPQPQGRIPILHAACYSGLASGDVIAYLANKWPESVKDCIFNDVLPLHLLLCQQHRLVTVGEVEVLLKIYPGAITKTASRYCGSSLLSALNNQSQDLINYIVRRYPKNARSLHLGGQERYMGGKLMYNTTNRAPKLERLEERHALAVSKLLPRLKTLCLAPNHWSKDAFHHVMMELFQQETLMDLTLHLPPDLLRYDEETCSTLQTLLEKNHNLQILQIDFGYPQQQQSGGGDLLAANTTSGMECCLRYLARGLCHKDNSLQYCHLGGAFMAQLTEFLRRDFWPPLAEALQHHNTTLVSVSMSHVQNRLLRSVHTNKESQIIQYYTRLNQYGRAKLRCGADLTMEVLVDVLLQANRAVRLSAMDRSNVVYGLLHESLWLWSLGSL